MVHSQYSFFKAYVYNKTSNFKIEIQGKGSFLEYAKFATHEQLQEALINGASCSSNGMKLLRAEQHTKWPGAPLCGLTIRQNHAHGCFALVPFLALPGKAVTTYIAALQCANCKFLHQAKAHCTVAALKFDWSCHAIPLVCTSHSAVLLNCHVTMELLVLQTPETLHVRHITHGRK